MVAFPLVLIALLPFLIIIGIIDMVLKAFALWKSARANQLAWFICLVIFNTAGILPAIYLLFFQPKTKKK